jgi:hypothetical protein
MNFLSVVPRFFMRASNDAEEAISMLSLQLFVTA